MRFIILLFLLLFINQLFCQIDFYIETDAATYSYGQNIFISFNLQNTTVDTVFVTFSCSFPFAYHIDDDYFAPYSFPIVFDIPIPPDSVLATNLIHIENVEIGDHELQAEFFYNPCNLISDPVFFTVESVNANNHELQQTNYHFSNYPNPFNHSTSIEFSITEHSDIEISVFNIKGQKIKTLTQAEYSQGSHSIIWNGIDVYGKTVDSGIYYFKLKVNGKNNAVNKCIMLK